MNLLLSSASSLPLAEAPLKRVCNLQSSDSTRSIDIHLADDNKFAKMLNLATTSFFLFLGIVSKSRVLNSLKIASVKP